QGLVVYCEPVLYGRGHYIRLVPDDSIPEYPALFICHANRQTVGLENQGFLLHIKVRPFNISSFKPSCENSVFTPAARPQTCSRITISVIPPHRSGFFENSS